MYPAEYFLIPEQQVMKNIRKETTDTDSESPVLQYLVREPKIQSAKNKAIILLHGVGSNEQRLFNFADQLPDDFLIIAPRGQFVAGAGRYAWYHVDFSTGKPVINKEQELMSRMLIRKFVAQVKQKYSVDEIYLGGFSQGAIMSYSIGLTNPNEIMGIISLSGRLLEEVRPLITLNEDLQKLKVFIAHGIQDNTLPVAYAREAKQYLENAGVSVNYHEYPMGHQINSAVLSDLKGWLTND